jgi:hypothetical protein
MKNSEPTPLMSAPQHSPLRAKSLDLFAKRRVISVAQSHLAPDEYTEWLKRALSLQIRIYAIDLYYEVHKTLNAFEEKPLWSDVESYLRSERRTNDDLLWQAYNDLHSYADVETRIHEFDEIDPREFASIAHLKCCDVRMARALIWTFKPCIDANVLRYWEIYDQCWELIEDVLDIKEDGTDWNFNFWLYRYMSGEEVTSGIDAASQTLWRKVSELETALKALPAQIAPAIVGSFHSTVLATQVARQSWRRVLQAISCGKVLRFSEHVRSNREVA